MPIFGLQPPGLLETIFEEIGVALAVLDREENLVFANRTARTLLGEGFEHPVTFREWRNKCRLQDAQGDEIPFDRSAVMLALGGLRVEAQEVRATLPNSTVKWLLTWAYPFSAMGLSGVIAFIVDETAEVELRRAVSQLQRMESLGAVAAGLTHNLNNMLDTITLGIQAAKCENTSQQEYKRRLDQISAAAIKAAELVRRLMQFARTQEMHYRLVQVNEVVSEVLHLTRPLFPQNIVVKTNLCDELPHVKADLPQLEQVLINLIVNALDAMPTGGELTISTAMLSDSCKLGGKQRGPISITVADTGIGIPKELQSVVFDPFFTTKPAGKGTGLGLASAYGIVKEHGGSITVHSTPSFGTAFVILLPAQPMNSVETSAAD